MDMQFTVDQFHGVFRDDNTTLWPAQWRLVVIAFALVVYPVWSAYASHPCPETPTFGLPCPTTIFTIGLLCFAVPPTPRSPLIAPRLWCLVGAQAALGFGVRSRATTA